jgi:hypothetical protein
MKLVPRLLKKRWQNNTQQQRVMPSGNVSINFEQLALFGKSLRFLGSSG